MIEKVNTNRDVLIAHTDRDFHKLGFSSESIRNFEKIFTGSGFSKLKASTKNLERYQPIDFKNDMTSCKSILEELLQINQAASFDDYANHSV